MRAFFHSGGFIQMALLEHDRDHVDEDAPIALPFIDYSNWDQEPIPDRDWAVLDRIPLRQTSLFSGEGGSGKSASRCICAAAHVLGTRLARINARTGAGDLYRRGRRREGDSYPP